MQQQQKGTFIPSTTSQMSAEKTPTPITITTIATANVSSVVITIGSSPILKFLILFHQIY
jgi:hypothetical protein